MDICPNVNPTYGPGTYSVGIQGLSAYTRFAIEVIYIYKVVEREREREREKERERERKRER